jgi:hypothetical protein
MIRRPFAVIPAFVLAMFAGTSAPAHAQRPAVWFVPDVVGQFNALSERADPMGFHIGESPNPSTCKHYQGLARIEGPDGTPYLIVTRSGNTPDIPTLPDDLVCDDSPGETGDGSLLVVRMGSRDRYGERFRSNRQTKSARFDVTPPDPRDTVPTWFRFQGGNGFPHYGHPGGMQAVGHMLALAIEHRYEPDLPKTVVLFVDMTDPINPAIRSQFPVENEVGEKAGLVALTPLPDGHYLMMVTGGSNATLAFYRSTITDLTSENLSWVFVDYWTADPLSRLTTEPDFPCFPGSSRTTLVCMSPDEVQMGANWPTTGAHNGNPHQTIQFLREGNINGPLFLAAARGKILSDADRIDLYWFECDTPLCIAGEQVRLTHASTRALTPHPNAGGERLANLAAASTFYVSPSGELLFYATEHDNDGPSGTVKAGEWRHTDMVRDGSPTTLPTLTVNGPFTIDEGSVGTLSATAAPPVTKAWMQLFVGQQYDGPYAVVDYDDYVLDDYNFLASFQFPFSFFDPLPPGYYQRTRSWRWFAPLFCNASAIADDIFEEGDVPLVRTLAGAGVVLGDPDLTLIADDSGTSFMDRLTSSVDFLADCDTYYNTPFDVRWDLDVNGSFETVGTSVGYNATAVDGPFTVDIPIRASHPAGGNQTDKTTTVTVQNVAPSIAGLRLTNSASQQINVDVPFALLRTPLTVRAAFTDPGRPDHQTAQVSWGDGVVENQTAFSTFTDAFGGATGNIVHTHRYTVSGQHLLELSVSDDDSGADTEPISIRVLSPAEAVAEIAGLLEDAIANATNPALRAALLKAQRALVGNEGAENGALRKLADGQDAAAAASIGQAINGLEDARAFGADVDTLIALLQQVLESLASA